MRTGSGSQNLTVRSSLVSKATGSGGFKVGGALGKTKKGFSGDVIILSQPC